MVGPRKIWSIIASFRHLSIKQARHGPHRALEHREVDVRLGGDLPEDEMESGTDVHAVASDRISLTPIQLDLMP